MRKVELDKDIIVHDYTVLGMGAHAIGAKYKTSPKRVRAIIDEYGIERKKAGSQVKPAEKVVDAKTVKYPQIIGKMWVVYDPNTDFQSNDVGNRSGVLTSYIERQYGVPTPPNYDRTKYYTLTGNYWWEQWLKVRIEDVRTETRLTRWASLDKDAIYNEYLTTNISVDKLATKYKVGKKRIQELIKEKGVTRKDIRGKSLTDRFKALEYKKMKYQTESDDEYLVVYDPNTDFMTTDLMNRGGHLTSYIRKHYNVPTPNFYERSLYYIKTGDYWWEQWLKVKSVKKKEVKVCPYCGWVTVDVNNNSGWFAIHLKQEHGISIEEYVKRFPDEREYFISTVATKNRRLETDPSKFVVCPVCKGKYARLTRHLYTAHNISRLDYAILYGDKPIISEEQTEKMREVAKIINMNTKFTKHSTYEQVLTDVIEKAGLEWCSDRKILEGKEIDILIPSLNLGIEVNGCEYHTEKYGKDKNYHLDKTIKCQENGITLLHIYDDEIHDHRRIVLSKLRHILHVDNDLPRIYARKCKIEPITTTLATPFLDENHIQGNTKATVYLGAFYEDKLIGVMSFLKDAPGQWTLNRFATDINYICCGVGSKLFKYFIKNFSYVYIKSFLDRRWCYDEESNIYKTLGFDFISYTEPEYRYYHKYLTKGKRLHKRLFHKERLMKQYGSQLTVDMTEREMTEKLGLERIWDCGMLRYVYTNPVVKKAIIDEAAQDEE